MYELSSLTTGWCCLDGAVFFEKKVPLTEYAGIALVFVSYLGRYGRVIKEEQRIVLTHKDDARNDVTLHYGDKLHDQVNSYAKLLEVPSLGEIDKTVDIVGDPIAPPKKDKARC